MASEGSEPALGEQRRAARSSLGLRQRYLNNPRKSFIKSDLPLWGQLSFPRCTPHCRRESTGPSRPSADCTVLILRPIRTRVPRPSTPRRCRCSVASSQVPMGAARACSQPATAPVPRADRADRLPSTLSFIDPRRLWSRLARHDRLRRWRPHLDLGYLGIEASLFYWNPVESRARRFVTRA